MPSEAKHREATVERGLAWPLRLARSEDLGAAHAIRVAAARELTRQFGEGHWTRVSDPQSLLAKVADRTLYVAELDAAIVGTVLLTPERIIFYRPEWFSDPYAKAAYVMDMSVHPSCQRRAIGRQMMDAAERLAAAHGLAAIRLDAYQGPAGAGPFYRKCGYRHVHSGSFRNIDLEYYEKLL